MKYVYIGSQEWLRRHVYCNYKGCVENKRCVRLPCISPAKKKWFAKTNFERHVMSMYGRKGRPENVLAILKVAERLGYFDDPFLVTIHRSGSPRDITDRLTKG